ncbi:MAG: amidohydrolase family protein [Planctomycetota bacterium]
MWRETTKHERNLRIWQEELEDFVPAKVLDFHVHIFNTSTLPASAKFPCGGHDIDGYDFDDLEQDLAEVYPDRETSAVCFGLPSSEYDRDGNNGYVAASCDGKRFFALRLVGPAEDPTEVRKDITTGGFLGFKPYLDYVGKSDSNLVEIHEMLPEGIMGVADELGLIIMLHIPRKQRLADPLNQRQLVELSTSWPNAKIVLAHIGRAYYLKNVVGYLDNLKDLPNLYFDTAMLNNWEVLEYLFQKASPEKVLYGTDIPIALAPGKSVEINDQYTYVTPVAWVLSISDDHRKLVFTSFLYEQLRAIAKAVRRLDLSRQFVEGLFYDNGMQLLHSVM